MEQVYFSKPSEPPSTRNDVWAKRVSKCAISSKNALAFAMRTTTHKGKLFRYTIIVIDVNMPWQHYKVADHNEVITCIEWDSQGERLMVCDEAGSILLFGMKNHALNEWTLMHREDFPGEKLLLGEWLNDGDHYSIKTRVKKKISSYSTKLFPEKFLPSCKFSGDENVDGCLAISAFGSVCALVLPREESAKSSVELLCGDLTRIRTVDICLRRTGDFLVATNDGLSSSVNFFTVSLEIEENMSEAQQSEKRLKIICQPFSSFLVSQETGSPSRVTHLRFLHREATDGIVVVKSGGKQSTLELWELRQKNGTAHPESSRAESKVQSSRWQLNTMLPCESIVTAIATPRRCLFQYDPPPSHVVIAFANRAIQCLERNKLTGEKPCPILPKADRTEDIVEQTELDMCLSHTGSILMIVDASNSQISMFRTEPLKGLPSGLSAKVLYWTALLEYCLVTKDDWLDVLFGMDSDDVEQVYTQLCENFEALPIATQESHDSRFQALLASLHRMQESKLEGDCLTRVMLTDIGKIIKSHVRPTKAAGGRTALAELTEWIENPRLVIADIDVLVDKLQHCDFSVDPEILPTLQPCVQWVTDLALNRSVPLALKGLTKDPNNGLLADPKCINAIRELLVICRIWGLSNTKCLPIYSDEIINAPDEIRMAFFFVTSYLPGQSLQQTEKLREILLVLELRLMVSRMEFCRFPTEGICGREIYRRTSLIALEYDTPWDFVRSSPPYSLSIDCYVPGPSPTDTVGLAYVGQVDGKIRRCTRCSRILLLRSRSCAGILKTLESHWKTHCPCGGSWTLISLSLLRYLGWKGVFRWHD